MEAAQRNAEVAREQAAKEAEKHAQLLAEQDKRHKEQMQGILDRLQPAVPPTPVATPPGQAPGLSSQSAAGPSARSAAQPPPPPPPLNWSQAFLCANFAPGARRGRISSSSRTDPASHKKDKRLSSVLA